MITNETFNEGLFDCEAGGYILLSRAMVLSLLKQLPQTGPNELYLFLLLHANFSPTGMPGKQKVKRGELYMSIGQLDRRLPASRSTLYRIVRTLEAAQVLHREKQGNRILFVLPKYEEHCGKLAGGKERAAQTAQERESERLFNRFFDYYHYAMGISPRDKEKALREWKRLRPEECECALEHVSAYAEASERQQFKKQAFSYLKDKSFKH